MMKFFPLLLCLVPVVSFAEEALPTVEDNIRAMDTDHDGQVSVTEVRAFLEFKHGKGYEQALLQDMQAKAESKSCGSPFSRSLY